MKEINISTLLTDSGRKTGEKVAAVIGRNPALYNQAIELTLFEKMPMQSRAGRVFFLCTEKYPDLIQAWLPKILSVANDEKPLHRSILWAFAELKVRFNEEQKGILLDKCFTWLMLPKLEVAETIACMTILYNHIQEYPELAPELAEIVRKILPVSSAGIKNRGTKILKSLQKLKLT